MEEKVETVKEAVEEKQNAEIPCLGNTNAKLEELRRYAMVYKKGSRAGLLRIVVFLEELDSETILVAEEDEVLKGRKDLTNRVVAEGTIVARWEGRPSGPPGRPRRRPGPHRGQGGGQQRRRRGGRRPRG